MVVSNDVVAPLYLEKLLAGLSRYQHEVLILPDGEHHKTLDTTGLIFDRLLEKRFDRGCTLLALGGGVVGDITGFAAACYQRGVDFVQVPTTLLAQVDSSVGGKTGVNHPRGKNMIGAFHQPRCVIADTVTLDTLPEREYCAGLAEIVKYGLIGDADFFDWLEAQMPGLRSRDPEMLAHAIECSCADKAEIVSQDERESGVRALLNLGHTFGHAIEAGLGYGRWLHGEAVAVGTMLAADLSARLGWLDSAAVERVGALLQRAGLPVKPPAELTPARLLELMAVDKKVAQGNLRLVLLRAIGRAVVSSDFSRSSLDQTLLEAFAGNPPS
jgi:3-dehydroquinate synthase